MRGVLHKFTAKIGDGGKHSTRNDDPFDFAEPKLDLVEPGRVGRCEMKSDLWICLKEISNCPSLVCRQVVEHNVNLLGPSGML